jgi:phospholipase D1/2
MAALKSSASESISQRAYQLASTAYSWEEIFDAGPYYERISELLEDAEHFAVFVGWQIDSRLSLSKPFRPGVVPTSDRGNETLREKILRLVERKPDFQFYFLMWDHAYFYVLERESWQGRIWDNLHPRVHFLFDNRHPFGGSHHEKICIIDGKTVLCGGIDLCDDRWDTPAHLYSDPRRSLDRTHEQHGPYHDLAVQVTGPVCREIHRHIQRRWRALSRIPFPAASLGHLEDLGLNPIPGHHVYLSRTLAHIEVRLQKSIIREIEFLFRELIHSAQHRIILEGQYYWSDEINDMLLAKINQMRGKDFEITIILADLYRLKSLSAHMSIYELKLLEKLDIAAKNAGVRLRIGNPCVHPSLLGENAGKEPRPVYIHSKVMVVDDRFISIGSANLATRALRLDTEMNLTFEAKTDSERSHVRRFAESVLRHWGLSDAPSNVESSVRFHSIVATEQIRRRLEEMTWIQRTTQKWVPWKFFFDPRIPWFHPVERKFRRHSHSVFPWVIAATGLLWVTSTVLAVVLAQAHGIWAWLYALVLTSVWFVPIPFSGVAVLGYFQLGFESSIDLSICALWIAALQGYSLTRLFPSYLTRFYRASGPSWLPKRLGLRQFPATVSVSLDPRISLRSKIAYQGLYCVPMPWFAMNLLLVVPGALYMLLWVLNRLVSPRITQVISGMAPKILVALVAYAVIRLLGSTFRKRTDR